MERSTDFYTTHRPCGAKGPWVRSFDALWPTWILLERGFEPAYLLVFVYDEMTWLMVERGQSPTVSTKADEQRFTRRSVTRTTDHSNVYFAADGPPGIGHRYPKLSRCFSVSSSVLVPADP